jgi:hypothetical protein
VIEPTSALDPAPSVLTPVAGGVSLDDELVLFPRLASEEVVERGGQKFGRNDARAVIRSGTRLAVVGATRVEVDGRTVHESATPYTGVLR